jgi:hypothetical protein
MRELGAYLAITQVPLLTRQTAQDMHAVSIKSKLELDDAISDER